MTRSLIAMSGGVDSSVAAFLIKEMGHETIGITLKLFDNDDVGLCRDNACCSASDVADAKSVCYAMGVPHYVFNFTGQFKDLVMDKFAEAYLCGATPNPCIDCNRFIKFEELLKRSYALECDYVVTGHYARREEDKSSGRFLLKRGLDRNKDQSYVLYNMTQEQLSRTLFPLGSYNKPEIRRIAEEQSFINARKRDSQDICFVPDGDYAKFLKEFTGKPQEPGDIIDTVGEVLGQHKGLIAYTIGQRKGLGIASDAPLYVVRKDLDRNELIVGREQELYSKSLDADDINLIAVDRISQPMKVKAKIRYSQNEHDAIVEQTADSSFHLEFTAPQRAVTKGQAVVLYEDDVVVGGGTIR